MNDSNSSRSTLPHHLAPAPALSRRELIGLLRKATAAAASAAPLYAQASTDSSDELIYMSATKLAGLIRARKVSALEAVNAYIERQIQVNDLMNAVVMNSYARARKEARELDAMAARGEFKGALHGVPMTIKDSLDTEGVISTGATYGRQQYKPGKDATVVARVRAAGAILLGKTNTPEFTLGGLGGISTASNLLYGSSHNPYDLTRSTAGSSGGAGAIVAAGGAAFDIGSDWGGSIRGPSHNNGIAGIKPTSVRVPRTGHIVDYGGIFDLWQQLGPMTRRVEDLMLITPIISGPDFRDASCAPVPWADPRKVDLKKLKVAFCADNGGTGRQATDEDTKKTVRQAAKWLEGATLSVKEDAPLAVLEDLRAARSALTSGDGWAFYKRLADKWHTVNFSPQRKEAMGKATPISSAAMVEAWEQHDLAKSRMLEWMKNYDVFICPTAGKPAQPIDQEGAGGGGGSSPGGGWPYTGVFNSTGWPSVVVRCGSSADGKLPIGLQVVAAPWREDLCLAVAAFLEQQSGGWKRPPI
ncbi:amidase [Solimonas aquatica]|uniref:Amidase n=1 Tax=Solimonas aquatica TaxID=489703 RepID=A0A1H9AIR3_9GAMM|nr:amidase [Solimonas aquatica]SEP75838.1 amidase [Solimonas aquatica]